MFQYIHCYTADVNENDDLNCITKNQLISVKYLSVFFMWGGYQPTHTTPNLEDQGLHFV
jgi:hypothetical protein